MNDDIQLRQFTELLDKNIPDTAEYASIRDMLINFFKDTESVGDFLKRLDGTIALFDEWVDEQGVEVKLWVEGVIDPFVAEAKRRKNSRLEAEAAEAHASVINFPKNK